MDAKPGGQKWYPTSQSWTPERIVGERGRGIRKEYLVKYKGWGNEHNWLLSLV